METYQEEYRRLKREQRDLEKTSANPNLSEQQKEEKKSNISDRLKFLEPHVKEAAKRIENLTELKNDIVVGRSKLEEMQRIIDNGTAKMSNQKLQSIREYLFTIELEDSDRRIRKGKVAARIKKLEEKYAIKETEFNKEYDEYLEFEKNFRAQDSLARDKGNDLEEPENTADQQQDVETSKPQGAESPRPQEGVEPPRPQEGVESPRPQEGAEPPRPQEGVESPRPQESAEPPRPQEGVEPPRPQEGVEPPKPQDAGTSKDEQKSAEEKKRAEEEKRQKEEKEKERKEKIENLNKEREQIKERILKLLADIKNIEKIIQEGKYTPHELLELQAELQSLKDELKILQSRVSEIYGQLETLQPVGTEKDGQQGKNSTGDGQKSGTKRDSNERSAGESNNDDKKKKPRERPTDNGQNDNGSGKPEKEDKPRPETPQRGTNGNGFDSPKPQSTGPLMNGRNVGTQNATEPVVNDKQLVKKNSFIEKIKEIIRKIKDKFIKEKEEKEAENARVLAEQANAERANAEKINAEKEKERMESFAYQIIAKEEKRENAELQLLNFPPARVEGGNFYHVVQNDDKLQYVKEPLKGMEHLFTEEALKSKIEELQEKYGAEAEERQGKKLSRIADWFIPENEEARQDFWKRRSYQQLLKSPDKIIKEYLGSSRDEERKSRIIQLMCGLEAANTAQEAGYACVAGLPKDLFSYPNKLKNHFLSGMDKKCEELMGKRIKRGDDKPKDHEKNESTPQLEQSPKEGKKPVNQFKMLAHPRKVNERKAAKLLPKDPNSHKSEDKEI